MELIIGDFRVRTLDDLNLVVEEHRDVLEKDKKTMMNTGAKRKDWCFVGYFGKLNHALNRIIEARINRSDTNTLVDLQKLVQQAKNDLLEEINSMDNRIYTHSERVKLKKYVPEAFVLSK